MERNHCQAATRREDRFSCDEATLQFAQLIVHGDTQRLEGPRCGIALVFRRETHRATHDLGQLAGCLDSLDLAGLDNGVRDPAAAAFLAVAPEDVGELHFVGFVHEIRCGWPALFHAHVERAVPTEGEAALGTIELHRRHTKVERHTVDIIDALGGQQLGHVAEAALDQLQTGRITLGQGPASSNRIRIAIDGNHPAVGAIEHRRGVATATEGAVDIATAVARIERLDHFARENRDMSAGAHVSPRSDRPRTKAAILSRSPSRRACQRMGFHIWNLSPLPTSMTPASASSACENSAGIEKRPSGSMAMVRALAER